MDELRVGQAPPGAIQGDLRDVGADQLGGPQLAGQPAVAAAQVQRALRGRQRPHELHEVLGRRAGVLGDRLPDLVVEAGHGST